METKTMIEEIKQQLERAIEKSAMLTNVLTSHFDKTTERNRMVWLRAIWNITETELLLRGAKKWSNTGCFPLDTLRAELKRLKPRLSVTYFDIADLNNTEALKLFKELYEELQNIMKALEQ
jgi:hypothetical protein